MIRYFVKESNMLATEFSPLYRHLSVDAHEDPCKPKQWGSLAPPPNEHFQ